MFLRGVTSKGISFEQFDLPAVQKEWNDIFLGIMGSPDAKHDRQLDATGEGVSSLSKVTVVGPPTTRLSAAQGV